MHRFLRKGVRLTGKMRQFEPFLVFKLALKSYLCEKTTNFTKTAYFLLPKLEFRNSTSLTLLYILYN